MSEAEPLVSVLTPVYNGEPYIAECVASVLAQTYPNWRYVVVNNCSKDNTLKILESYAARDQRISIHNNNNFVGVVDNHNIAFSLIEPRCKYVKLVSADDWLYPECISRLVEFAERNPGVGIVGSYAISNTGINSLGIPYDRSVFKASDICRPYLLGNIDAFATPSAVLYRADLIRSRSPFFPTSHPNADLAAALLCLEISDFGFVHQILSFQRVHAGAVSHPIHKLGGFLVDRLEFLKQYGSTYLTRDEHSRRELQLLHEYYAFLATGVINFRGRDFWTYHNSRLDRLGHSLYSMRLVLALLDRLADLALNPKLTLERIARRLRRTRQSS